MTDHPDPTALTDQSASMAEEVRDLLGGSVEEPMPLHVLQGLLVALDAESDRRLDGGATRDHATAIQEALDRTDQGSFGSNPLHPTGAHRPERKQPRRTVEH